MGESTHSLRRRRIGDHHRRGISLCRLSGRGRNPRARATIVLATQAYTSIHGALDKRYADVLMLSLSNELILTVANYDSAVIASKNIGEREVVEKSWGWAGGNRSYNYQKRIKPYFEAYRLRKLPKVIAIIRHCEKPFRRRLIPPINPDGTFPKWFTYFHPSFTLHQWLKCKPQTGAQS